jgi:hypothetical protein
MPRSVRIPQLESFPLRRAGTCDITISERRFGSSSNPNGRRSTRSHPRGPLRRASLRSVRSASRARDRSMRDRALHSRPRARHPTPWREHVPAGLEASLSGAGLRRDHSHCAAAGQASICQGDPLTGALLASDAPTARAADAELVDSLAFLISRMVRGLARSSRRGDVDHVVLARRLAHADLISEASPSRNRGPRL